MSDKLIPTWGTGVKRRGPGLIEYARGAGGRIDVLPTRYLDMVAEAVVHCHPECITQPMRELLVSGRYRRSQHPQLRDLSVADLRRIRSAHMAFIYARRVRGRTRQAVVK